MKCLGALDSFIVRLFIIEAFLLGALGSIAGIIVGIGIQSLILVKKIGFSATLSSCGVHVLGIPLWLSLIITFLLGSILSILAAVYPAWRAAKMQAAAALRSDF
jgi:ABC-type lipoprotein release transport system permease subunit